MIVIEETRFGTIEVDESSLLVFDNGLVGFPEQQQFVLLERSEGKMVAILQSVTTPTLAFPVIDGSDIEGYPDPPVPVLAKRGGLSVDPNGSGEHAVLVIVAVNAKSKLLEANLLAPLIVNLETRKCAQVVLDARKFSAAETVAPPLDPVAEAKARIERLRRGQTATSRSGASV